VLGNSLIFDNGTNVGIGNTNTSYKLDVSGTGNFTGALSGTSATFSSTLTTGGKITANGGGLLLDLVGGSDTFSRVTGNRGNGDSLHVANIEFYNSFSSRLVGEMRGITGAGGTQSNSGQLAFYTNNAGTYAERMRITSGGSVLFQKTAANNTDTGAGWFVNDYFCVTNNSADSGDRVVLINRQNSDGTLIDFRHANVTEGSISVSGSTVSYLGGHLSRYSQTELDEKIEGLLKGTVMSNLDKMAEWINPETKEPYENEQLNCMKISDVEGDKNVAGVFVNWQYDSELLTNDMNIAMTGDMIIRIAQGLVVEKGDLLISAGGGTAKPQSDDLIRSNTIAKVTSNHITCVYEDGSYCVPCVLMAC
jgi:hypothetical protein